MSPERVEHLINLVGPFVSKKQCRSRDVISPAERIVLTLRYLATGDSQQSLSFAFRIGRSTVCHIISETCEGIWKALHTIYLKSPGGFEEWKAIAQQFETEWNFPHCLGALDGKHIAIECPKNGGSNYFNYKGFNSMVLMAICDSRYYFSFVDIGGYGRDNDASIFSQTGVYKAFTNNKMCIPEPESKHGIELPYVLVSDEIFPLKPWLMKPYPGKGLPESKEIFNYRLSRCRRTIENTFGILAAKWRIFRRPIRANPETVEKIIKVCVCLHNYLKLTYSSHYVPDGFVDSEDNTGNCVPGDWRQLVAESDGALRHVSRSGSNNYTLQAKELRERFEQYFISQNGSVPWQYKHVRSCGPTSTS